MTAKNGGVLVIDRITCFSRQGKPGILTGLLLISSPSTLSSVALPSFSALTPPSAAFSSVALSCLVTLSSSPSFCFGPVFVLAVVSFFFFLARFSVDGDVCRLDVFRRVVSPPRRSSLPPRRSSLSPRRSSSSPRPGERFVRAIVVGRELCALFCDVVFGRGVFVMCVWAWGFLSEWQRARVRRQREQCSTKKKDPISFLYCSFCTQKSIRHIWMLMYKRNSIKKILDLK